MVDSIIFDLDGTLTQIASPWRHVHQRLGLWDDIASEYLDEWLSGGISYEEFCRRDFELWKGHSLEEIESLLDEIEINPHVPGIVDRLKGRGILSIIISSGFSRVAKRIQSRFKWEPLLIYANELVEGPDVLIRVSADPDSPVSKRRLSTIALEQAGVDPARSLVVSDSVQDLDLMAECQYRLWIQNEDDLLEVYRFIDNS
jgi:HAD superfamily phosphoserine phosphatase-like hydrolase